MSNIPKGPEIAAVYEWCIKNSALCLKDQDNSRRDALSAFKVSEVLALAFCKRKETVVEDLVSMWTKLTHGPVIEAPGPTKTTCSCGCTDSFLEGDEVHLGYLGYPVCPNCRGV